MGEEKSEHPFRRVPAGAASDAQGGGGNFGRRVGFFWFAGGDFELSDQFSSGIYIDAAGGDGTFHDPFFENVDRAVDDQICAEEAVDGNVVGVDWKGAGDAGVRGDFDGMGGQFCGDQTAGGKSEVLLAEQRAGKGTVEVGVFADGFGAEQVAVFFNQQIASGIDEAGAAVVYADVFEIDMAPASWADRGRCARRDFVKRAALVAMHGAVVARLLIRKLDFMRDSVVQGIVFYAPKI